MRAGRQGQGTGGSRRLRARRGKVQVQRLGSLHPSPPFSPFSSSSSSRKLRGTGWQRRSQSSVGVRQRHELQDGERPSMSREARQQQERAGHQHDCTVQPILLRSASRLLTLCHSLSACCTPGGLVFRRRHRRGARLLAVTSVRPSKKRALIPDEGRNNGDEQMREERRCFHEKRLSDDIATGLQGGVPRSTERKRAATTTDASERCGRTLRIFNRVLAKSD